MFRSSSGTIETFGHAEASDPTALLAVACDPPIRAITFDLDLYCIDACHGRDTKKKHLYFQKYVTVLRFDIRGIIYQLVACQSLDTVSSLATLNVFYTGCLYVGSINEEESIQHEEMKNKTCLFEVLLSRGRFSFQLQWIEKEIYNFSLYKE